VLELTPFSRTEFLRAYQRTEEPVEKARRLVVRSFAGFGSTANRDYITGFRAASKQSGRPHSLDWANIPECLHAVTWRLQGVTIENRCALQIIRQQDTPDTLFYCDPPYLRASRNCSGRQYRFDFGDSHHEDLAAHLRHIKGRAVVSAYPSPLYDRLYAGWRRVTTTALAASNVGSIHRTEVLWMNF